MEEGRAKRKCPRIPVYLDVRVDLKDGTVVKGKVINLSTEGICIKTDDPIFAKEEITVEFLREGRRMPRLLVGDECDGIRFKYPAKPPSRDAPTFGRRGSLPDTLTSVRLGGEVVWYRFDKKAVAKQERVHFSGVRFLDLGESY